MNIGGSAVIIDHETIGAILIVDVVTYTQSICMLFIHDA